MDGTKPADDACLQCSVRGSQAAARLQVQFGDAQRGPVLEEAQRAGDEIGAVDDHPLVARALERLARLAELVQGGVRVGEPEVGLAEEECGPRAVEWFDRFGLGGESRRLQLAEPLGRRQAAQLVEVGPLDERGFAVLEEVLHGLAGAGGDELDRGQRRSRLARLGEEHRRAADLTGRDLREGQTCFGACLSDGPRAHGQPREPAALAAGLLADYHTGCQPNSRST